MPNFRGPLAKRLALGVGASIALIVVLLTVSYIADSTSSNTVRVGSKSFTESVILGDVICHLIRDSGQTADHESELGGTQVLWNAMRKGDIDVYVDYTGTIREELLSDSLKNGVRLLTDEDMRGELAKQGVYMSQRLGFNNTYALGIKESTAERLGIRTISDLKQHPELKLGLSDEFMERNDGWRQLAKHYKLPQESVRTMDHNLAYRGIEHDAIDITDLYTTDAEIEYYKLRTLEDDLGFFPTYHAVLLIRNDLQERSPKAWNSILRLQESIDSSEMIAMSAQVRLDLRPETVVAAQFVNDSLGLNVEIEKSNWLTNGTKIASRLLTTTKEHLFLVLTSLSMAILVSIPLGIFASRNEKIGQAILAVVGIIQTLPSMALLVFMIPLFGLGAIPAIAALFFYSLLPIVRSTYIGITQIPAATKESAIAVGLDQRARLWLVELPLALPSILSGIKTAAVINVGTATIGALIGAGGYGSSILTGIRLANIPLILQGAVPAACMAILVQFGFGYLEKVIVSPGLRISQSN